MPGSDGLSMAQAREDRNRLSSNLQRALFSQQVYQIRNHLTECTIN
jgi:hypothetical protein